MGIFSKTFSGISINLPNRSLLLSLLIPVLEYLLKILNYEMIVQGRNDSAMSNTEMTLHNRNFLTIINSRF
jgi:hypothetical protein